MATTYSTDAYANGQSNTKTVPPGTLIAVDFDTNVSPGANVGAAIVLAINDEIRLCYIPDNAVIEGYNIDIGDMDGGAALELSLRDGAGNIYQAAITSGQAGGKITDANAITRFIGVAKPYTHAQAYLTLLVTAAAASASSAAGRVSGRVLLRQT